MRTLADALVREADGIAVHVLTFEEGERTAPRRRLPPVGGLDGYVAAAMAVSIATLLGEELTKHVALPNVSMIFLLAVLIPALFFGVWPAVFASLFSALAYNFFFIDPVYTFTIARPHEVLALVIFLVIAVIISAVAGRAREQAKASAQRVKAGRRLYDFTRKLSSLADAPEVAAGAASEIHAILSRAAVILSSTRGELHIAAAWPPEDRLDTASLSAARWAYEHGEPAGARTATLPSVPWLFIPLKARQGIIGVIGIEALSGEPLDAEGRVLLDALADQTASALERAALAARWRMCAALRRRSGCATSCSPPSATISARPCPPFSARHRASSNTAPASIPSSGATCSRRSARRRTISTAWSATSSP